ncbi:hypothetical protein KIPB_013635, partial [Kipferlia bialata]
SLTRCRLLVTLSTAVEVGMPTKDYVWPALLAVSERDCKNIDVLYSRVQRPPTAPPHSGVDPVYQTHMVVDLIKVLKARTDTPVRDGYIYPTSPIGAYIRRCYIQHNVGGVSETDVAFILHSSVLSYSDTHTDTHTDTDQGMHGGRTGREREESGGGGLDDPSGRGRGRCVGGVGMEVDGRSPDSAPPPLSAGSLSVTVSDTLVHNANMCSSLATLTPPRNPLAPPAPLSLSLSDGASVPSATESEVQRAVRLRKLAEDQNPVDPTGQHTALMKVL